MHRSSRRIVDRLPAECLALVIDFVINGEGGTSRERRPKWLRLALVARRWHEPASAAYLSIADFGTRRAGEVPLREAARMRTLELVAECVAMAEHREQIDDAEADRDNWLVALLDDVNQAFVALRPALGALRCLKTERVRDAFLHKPLHTGISLGPDGDLGFMRDMAALRSLETSVTDIVYTDMDPGAAALRGALYKLVVLLKLSGPRVLEMLGEDARFLSPAEIPAGFVASAHSLVHLDLSIDSVEDRMALTSAYVRPFLLQHQRIEYLSIRVRRTIALDASQVAPMLKPPDAPASERRAGGRGARGDRMRWHAAAHPRAVRGGRGVSVAGGRRVGGAGGTRGGPSGGD